LSLAEILGRTGRKRWDKGGGVVIRGHQRNSITAIKKKTGNKGRKKRGKGERVRPKSSK